ncbi:MAG: hypothetical protein IKZ21_00750, partial [Clostridia bacterium]|nr:hypothetical protein [Clostridia bacterium]
EYTGTATAPDSWEMDMAGLKQNTDRVTFTIFADGEQVTEDLGTLGFQVETDLPGDLAFEADGTITFQPKYQEPITAIPTGEVEIKGTLPSGAEASVTVNIIAPEYKLEAEVPSDAVIARTDLGKNTTGVTFRLYMDGIQQDKTSVEAADLELTIPARYQKRITLTTTIADNGDILVVPGYEGWRWFAAWLIPRGDLVITAAALGEKAEGILVIDWDWSWEITFNYVIPLLILAFIVGHLVKKRLPYGGKIRKSTSASSVGNTIQVPANQWRVTGLWTWTALIPYLQDRKKVGDVKVYARGGRAGIGIYAHKYPKASGFALGDYETGRLLSIYKSSIERFNQDEEQKNKDEKKKKGSWLKRMREARRERIKKRRKNSRLKGFSSGSVLVISSDPNYGTSTIYIYEKKARRRKGKRRTRRR